MRSTSIHRRHWLTWRSWHKWVGVVFSVFIIIFCCSGIVLNHRKAFSNYEVSRWWLPSQYHLENWNQGIVKGTLKIEGSNSFSYPLNIIAYGQCGVWLTDEKFGHWKSLNAGLGDGIDNWKINNVVQTGDGAIWCAALYDAYRFDTRSNKWQKVNLPGNDERLSDITVKGEDTIIVVSRSVVYEAIAPSYNFKKIQLRAPDGYKPEVQMFKTVWMLHSGELFGIVGKLVVDFLGIVIILLCITGIVFFLLGYNHKLPKPLLSPQACGKALKFNLRWHNKLGAGLIVLTTLLAVTGMCLRPPLMVPLVLNKTAPLPGSAFDTDNAFKDKIRAIRWNEELGCWIMSTSEGFYRIGSKKEPSVTKQNCGDLEDAVPVKIDKAPVVSPMGITVFTRNPYNKEEWLVGSFSGMERWNPMTGMIAEWFDDAPAPSPIPSLEGHHVTGFSTDITCSPIVFEYSDSPSVGKGRMPQMPDVLKDQPMSLWNFALELHVGRCYEPFLGSILSILFVFISGLLLTLILISGYIIYKRK